LLDCPGQDGEAALIDHYENTTSGVVPDFSPENDQIFSGFTHYNEVENKEFAEHIQPVEDE